MTERYLDKIYATTTETGRRDLYDAWAGSYDDELTDNGYATPGRVGLALAGLADTSAPVLDFGCGTGLSGLALAAAGFATIDGYDVSEGMLAEARGKAVYRRLWSGSPDAPSSISPGEYGAIAAAGVISTGAAPPETLDMLLDGLAPGALLALSYNDHTLDDDAYTERLAALTAPGARAEQLFAEHGAHLPGIGLGATVYVLRRR